MRVDGWPRYVMHGGNYKRVRIYPFLFLSARSLFFLFSFVLNRKGKRVSVYLCMELETPWNRGRRLSVERTGSSKDAILALLHIHYCHFSFEAIIIKNINGPTFFMEVLIYIA